MKKLLLVCLLSLLGLTTFSQKINHVTINGKIVVEGSDIEGIAIYNTTAKEGTITDEKGEFKLSVALNDIIEVRSLEYNDLNIAINEAIIFSRRMRIFLIEEVTKLDEIEIPNKKLTGNLKADATLVKTFNSKDDAVYFGIKDNDTSEFNNGEQIKNTLMAAQDQTQTLVDGLNIINVVDQLLIPLFRSEVKDKKAAGIPAVPVKSIKYYLGSDFLIENFNIPEHRVEEFIRYVEDETFNFDLLNYGHELEFLELLNAKSKLFLKNNTKTNK